MLTADAQRSEFRSSTVINTGHASTPVIPALRKQIPRTCYSDNLANIVSSGFKWESLSQISKIEWLRKLPDITLWCLHACIQCPHLCTHTWTHIYIYTPVQSRQSLRVPLRTKQDWVDMLCTICHHTSTDLSACYHRVSMVHLWKFNHLIDTSLSYKSPCSLADHNCPFSCLGLRVRIWFYP